MRALGDLWAGRLPLGEAFWKHAVLIGLALNIAATGGMFAAVAAGLPDAAALAIHLSPLPYSAACVLGVWRSAAPGRIGAGRGAGMGGVSGADLSLVLDKLRARRSGTNFWFGGELSWTG